VLVVIAAGAGLFACRTATLELAAPPPAPPPPSAAEVKWRAYFEDISQGAILVRLDTRRLSYWSPEGDNYREFPIAVAQLPEYEMLGMTEVVRRRVDPDWRPTPSMLERNPGLPRYVPPGPDNPMGEHALYLGWTHYAIHGTNNPASIGRASTSGCIRMFPDHIAWLFEQVEIGTPVLVVRES
jgi:lipoprotein-anchoring transpeptidase ErfK/SrfK